jgi:O-antigen/teichoic acid export membrane protein
MTSVKSYFKSLVILLSGSGGAQLINFLSYPILTKLYEPSQFGKYALYIAVISLLGIISCGRFESIIQISQLKETRDTYNIAKTVNIIFSLIVLFVLLAISLFNEFFSTVECILIFLGVFLTGKYNASMALILKEERYKIHARLFILRSLVTIAVQVLSFYVLPNFYGLILGTLTALMVHNLSFEVFIDINKSKLAYKRACVVFRKYREIIVVDIPSQLISAANLYGMVYIMAYLFDESTVGYYSMANKLVMVPIAVVAATLSNLFFQKASKSYNQTGSFANELKINLIFTISLAALIYITSKYLAYDLTLIFLGDGWIKSAEIILILIPLMVVKLISATVASIPLIVKKPKYLLVNNLSLFTSMVLTFFISTIYTMNIVDTLQFYVYSNIVVCVTYVTFLLIYTRELNRR